MQHDGTACAGNADDTELEMPEHVRLTLCVRTVLCSHATTPLRDLDVTATRFKCGVSAAHDKGMSTWVPRNHTPVLLLGTPAGDNLVIVCSTGVAYAMSPALEVPPLPADVVLVANCTLDHDETFRVLVFDGENLPPTTAAGADSTPDSGERYRRLLHFFPQFFHKSEAAKSTFVLQWVGYYESALKFLNGEISVGHRIGGLLTTTDDAMRPTRPVRVQLPVTEITKFREKP
jgi:hypothetical protein